MKLAQGILKIGLVPSELPIVVETDDGQFITIEGNRRLAVLQVLLNPDLAKDTPIYRSFSKMNKESFDAIPELWISLLRRIAKLPCSGQIASTPTDLQV
ncbi:MAG: hypothetical protein JWR68_3351 [Polaromonas sp.]|nr:hypothetical protein [Polaromonas sp.]